MAEQMTWLEALRETVREYTDAPVVWGQYDCCQFARTYLRRATGRDVGGDLKYSTQREAMKILADHGGIDGFLIDMLGEPNDGASPGDIVLVSVSEDMAAAGVYNGSFVFTVDPDRGLSRAFEERIMASWPAV